MSSTPFTSCSIGVATVSAMTSGGAPGYDARTTIVGGTTSGYCATGSETYAIEPRITVTIERTAAKIGRSMKNREMFMSGLRGQGRHRRGRRVDRALLRRHHDARVHLLDAGDDDALVGSDALAHD